MNRYEQWKRRPFRKAYVRDYVKAIAEKHGVTEEQARKVLTWMASNMAKMIEDGEEIRIKGFGRVYFNKHSKTKEQ